MVYRVKDEDEAVRLANDSPYGLSASVNATDTQHAEEVGARISTGMVFINEPAGAAAELPFGGVKRSGVGRELGRYCMEEFVNKRLVKVAEEISRIRTESSAQRRGWAAERLCGPAPMCDSAASFQGQRLRKSSTAELNCSAWLTLKPCGAPSMTTRLESLSA